MKDKQTDQAAELRQLLTDFLGPNHYHRCVACEGRGCLSCRNTGMNQTPCPICDKDGIAFKRRDELVQAIGNKFLALLTALREDKRLKNKKHKSWCGAWLNEELNPCECGIEEVNEAKAEMRYAIDRLIADIQGGLK